MKDKIVCKREGTLYYEDVSLETSAQMLAGEGYNVIVFCNAGRMQAEIGSSDRVMLEQGQALAYPSGKTAKGLMVSPDLKISILCVSDEQLRTLLGPQIEVWNKAMYLHRVQVVDASWFKGFYSHIREIYKSISSPLHFEQEIINAHLRMSLLLICEEFIKQFPSTLEKSENNTTVSPSTPTGDETSRERELFNSFIGLLSHRRQKRQTVAQYAAELYITPKYLSMVCKKVSGKTPLKWINEYVVDDIRTLLKDTDLSVKELSDRLGFPNSSFFGRYFREQMGMTPLDYRMKHRE